MDRAKLYNDLYKGYCDAHPMKSKSKCQEEVVAIWTGIKNEQNVATKVEELLKQYKGKSMKSKSS